MRIELGAHGCVNLCCLTSNADAATVTTGPRHGNPDLRPSPPPPTHEERPSLALALGDADLDLPPLLPDPVPSAAALVALEAELEAIPVLVNAVAVSAPAAAAAAAAAVEGPPAIAMAERKEFEPGPAQEWVTVPASIPWSESILGTLMDERSVPPPPVSEVNDDDDVEVIQKRMTEELKQSPPQLRPPMARRPLARTRAAGRVGASEIVEHLLSVEARMQSTRAGPEDERERERWVRTSRSFPSARPTLPEFDRTPDGIWTNMPNDAKTQRTYRGYINAASSLRLAELTELHLVSDYELNGTPVFHCEGLYAIDPRFRDLDAKAVQLRTLRIADHHCLDGVRRVLRAFGRFLGHLMFHRNFLTTLDASQLEGRERWGALVPNLHTLDITVDRLSDLDRWIGGPAAELRELRRLVLRVESPFVGVQERELLEQRLPLRARFARFLRSRAQHLHSFWWIAEKELHPVPDLMPFVRDRPGYEAIRTMVIDAPLRWSDILVLLDDDDARLKNLKSLYLPRVSPQTFVLWLYAADRELQSPRSAKTATLATIEPIEDPRLPDAMHPETWMWSGPIMTAHRQRIAAAVREEKRAVFPIRRALETFGLGAAFVTVANDNQLLAVGQFDNADELTFVVRHFTAGSLTSIRCPFASTELSEWKGGAVTLSRDPIDGYDPLASDLLRIEYPTTFAAWRKTRWWSKTKTMVLSPSMFRLDFPWSRLVRLYLRDGEGFGSPASAEQVLQTLERNALQLLDLEWNGYVSVNGSLALARMATGRLRSLRLGQDWSTSRRAGVRQHHYALHPSVAALSTGRSTLRQLVLDSQFRIEPLATFLHIVAPSLDSFYANTCWLEPGEQPRRLASRVAASARRIRFVVNPRNAGFADTIFRETRDMDAASLIFDHARAREAAHAFVHREDFPVDKVTRAARDALLRDGGWATDDELAAWKRDLEASVGHPLPPDTTAPDTLVAEMVRWVRQRWTLLARWRRAQRESDHGTQLDFRQVLRATPEGSHWRAVADDPRVRTTRASDELAPPPFATFRKGFVTGTLSFHHIDNDEPVDAKLTALRGVGSWIGLRHLRLEFVESDAIWPKFLNSLRPVGHLYPHLTSLAVAVRGRTATAQAYVSLLEALKAGGHLTRISMLVLGSEQDDLAPAAVTAFVLQLLERMPSSELIQAYRVQHSSEALIGLGVRGRFDPTKLEVPVTPGTERIPVEHEGELPVGADPSRIFGEPLVRVRGQVAFHRYQILRYFAKWIFPALEQVFLPQMPGKGDISRTPPVFLRVDPQNEAPLLTFPFDSSLPRVTLPGSAPFRSLMGQIAPIFGPAFLPAEEKERDQPMEPAQPAPPPLPLPQLRRAPAMEPGAPDWAMAPTDVSVTLLPNLRSPAIRALTEARGMNETSPGAPIVTIPEQDGPQWSSDTRSVMEDVVKHAGLRVPVVLNTVQRYRLSTSRSDGLGFHLFDTRLFDTFQPVFFAAEQKAPGRRFQLCAAKQVDEKACRAGVAPNLVRGSAAAAAAAVSAVDFHVQRGSLSFVDGHALESCALSVPPILDMAELGDTELFIFLHAPFNPSAPRLLLGTEEAARNLPAIHRVLHVLLPSRVLPYPKSRAELEAVFTVLQAGSGSPDVQSELKATGRSELVYVHGTHYWGADPEAPPRRNTNRIGMMFMRIRALISASASSAPAPGPPP